MWNPQWGTLKSVEVRDSQICRLLTDSSHVIMRAQKEQKQRLLEVSVDWEREEERREEEERRGGGMKRKRRDRSGKKKKRKKKARSRSRLAYLSIEQWLDLHLVNSSNHSIGFFQEGIVISPSVTSSWATHSWLWLEESKPVPIYYLPPSVVRSHVSDYVLGWQLIARVDSIHDPNINPCI